MTDLRGGHSSEIKPTALDSRRHGQAQNTVEEQGGACPNVGVAADEALKDRVDGAVRSGPKKADEMSGGRVQVGETGDLRDLAARRQS
ncbi:hypothetical protein AAE478_003453 [Parahypoxylon ruwenzoriense]